MGTWERSERENAIRDGREWAELDGTSKSAVMADRIFILLKSGGENPVRKDPVGTTGLTVQEAADLVGMGDFHDLASEVARSLSADDPHQANSEFPGRDATATDPDDPEQWSAFRSYVIKRARNIVLPAMLRARGRERGASREIALSGAGPESDPRRGRKNARAPHQTINLESVEGPQLAFGDALWDSDLPEEDALDSKWDGFGDDFDAKTVVAECGDGEADLPERMAAFADAAESAAGRRSPSRGAYLWDDDRGDYRYFYPREAGEASVARYLDEFDLDPVYIVRNFEERNGRAMTLLELAAVRRELRLIETETRPHAYRFLTALFGVDPDDADFSRREVCSPEYAGTENGRTRHKDRVAREASPLLVDLRNARKRLQRARATAERNAIEEATRCLQKAKDDMGAAILANFAYREPLPGIAKSDARERYGNCDLCLRPRECSAADCSATFKPPHGNVKRCEEHRIPPRPPRCTFDGCKSNAKRPLAICEGHLLDRVVAYWSEGSAP
jgi:hypothetical protein